MALLLVIPNLYPSQVFSQCSPYIIQASINASFDGVINGSIILTGWDKLIAQPGEMYSCTTGALITGNTIVVNAVEIKRTQSVTWANITIDGGTLIICGAVSVLNFTIKNGGALILNGGSLSMNTNVTIPAGCRIVNANGSVAFSTLQLDKALPSIMMKQHQSLILIGNTTMIY